MPTLILIDSILNQDAGAFNIPDEEIRIPVTDRSGAFRVLRSDLRATADPTWAADILTAFEQGENEITRPNGREHAFTVKYVE